MKVLITDYQYEDVDKERHIIEDAGFELIARTSSTKQEIMELAGDADAVITQYAEIDEEIIQSLKRCKVIIRYGIGINNIDATAASRCGIYVCNVPDYSIDEVSNHAAALLLALLRKIPVLTASLNRGDWGYADAVPIRRMRGSTLGFIGFGRIPQCLSEKMQGFGIHMLAYDPYCDEAVMTAQGVEKASFEAVLSKSDAISIHCPYTEETYHLFDRASFEKMKSSAVLVNTARGPIVEEEALLFALQNNLIAGAGLDVFEQEPPSSSSPLFSLPNVIATPHVAWYSEEAIDALQISVAEEAVRILKGGAPLHACNLEQLGT